MNFQIRCVTSIFVQIVDKLRVVDNWPGARLDNELMADESGVGTNPVLAEVLAPLAMENPVELVVRHRSSASGR
ncbi:hypothetical protein ACFYV7_15150 [Nocardia suismassiliense]|uniref:Transposase n=1 Tax=Nocardia suismassiliense TaxID=2077092 RepID=A0ABW6QSW9_9NOCA